MTGEMTFDQALGQWVRGQRELFGLTQVQLSGFMRRKGQPWERSTVTKVEAGRRAVTAEELFALQMVFEEGEFSADGSIRADKLVNHWLLPDVAVFQSDAGPAMYGSGPDEETKRVADSLGVDATWLDVWSAERWHCSFTEARDRRALEAAGEAGAEDLRAFRGHASRALMAEVREAISELSPRQRRQVTGGVPGSS
jgi:transcriptional regulator with XRE-family HTH domain